MVTEAISPVHADFRALSLEQAFHWSDGIVETPESGLYVVAFRSQRNLAAPAHKIARLLELDNEAFAEAQLLPGFRTYWHDDELSPEGHGLSFCLWDSQADAKHAASQPRHIEAVRYARTEGRDVYHSYEVETHRIYRFIGHSVLFEPAA